MLYGKSFVIKGYVIHIYKPGIFGKVLFKTTKNGPIQYCHQRNKAMYVRYIACPWFTLQITQARSWTEKYTNIFGNTVIK